MHNFNNQVSWNCVVQYALLLIIYVKNDNAILHGRVVANGMQALGTLRATSISLYCGVSGETRVVTIAK